MSVSVSVSKQISQEIELFWLSVCQSLVTRESRDIVCFNYLNDF